MLKCSKLLRFIVNVSPKHDEAHGLRTISIAFSQSLSDVIFGIRSIAKTN